MNGLLLAGPIDSPAGKLSLCGFVDTVGDWKSSVLGQGRFTALRTGEIPTILMVARGRFSGVLATFRTPVGGSKALYASMGVNCPLHHRATEVANLRELCNLLFPENNELFTETKEKALQ